MNNPTVEPLSPHLVARQVELALNALARLNPRRTDNRDNWLKVGMILHSIAADNLELLQKWIDWSRQSERFEEGQCEIQWQSFKPDGGLKLGTLIKWANEDEAAELSPVRAATPTSLAEFNRKLNFSVGNGPAVHAKPPAPSKLSQSLDDLVAAVGKRIPGTEVGRWMYRDRDGNEVLCVVRFQRCDGDKTYRQFSKSPDGWTAGGIEHGCPIYRLPHILAADPAMTVYVCEGEKSAEMAVLIGLNATTSCQGAQSPGKTDWTPLVGRNVVILPDNDEPGRNYATKLLGLLSPLGVA